MSTNRSCSCVTKSTDMWCVAHLIFWFISPFPSHLLNPGDLQPEQTSFYLSFTFTSLWTLLNLGWPLHVQKGPPAPTLWSFLCACVMWPLLLLSSLPSKEQVAYWVSYFLFTDDTIKGYDGVFFLWCPHQLIDLFLPLNHKLSLIMWENNHLMSSLPLLAKNSCRIDLYVLKHCSCPNHFSFQS